MVKKTIKHKYSVKHKKYVIDLAMLEKLNIANQLSDTYRQKKIKHNEKVRQN